MLDQAQGLRDLVKNKEQNSYLEKKYSKAKVITITSGKGGVGKSNIVVNIAILLKQMGKNVLIFDADIGMGNDDILLGVHPKYSIYDVISKNVSISDAIVKTSSGVNLLAGGSGLNKVEELTKEEREKFIEALNELQDFDYILMDTGAGINKTVLGFIAACDELFLITTPEPTSLTDAYSLIKAMKHFKLKNNAKIIINKCFSEREAVDTYLKFKKVAKSFLAVELEYLGFIFEDRKLVEAVRKQSPVVIMYPNSDTAKCLKKIVSSILIDNNCENRKGFDGFFKKLFNLFS